MRSLEDTIQVLENAGFKFLFDDDTSVLEPAIELKIQPGGSSSVGSTRLGGFPDVPPDFVWPMDGKFPLSFIAQVDLASLRGRIPEIAAPLPATGVLSFFFNSSKQPWGHDLEDRTSWAVFHFDRSDLLTPAQIPSGAEAFSAIELSPQPTWTVRPMSQFGIADMDFLAPYQEMYSSQFHEDLPADPQLLGYPFEVQSDMRGTCQSGLDNVGSEDGCSKFRRAGFEDWQLLLQVGSTGEMMWGDSGCIYYWIRRQDLAERRWDRVWVMLQCF